MNTEAIKTRFKSLWEGRIPLAQTFWQYYFIAVIVLGLIGNYITLFGVVALFWAGFMVMPIWRSSDKYQGKPLYALLAKIAAVLIGFGVLANLSG